MRRETAQGCTVCTRHGNAKKKVHQERATREWRALLRLASRHLQACIASRLWLAALADWRIFNVP